jgi:hypothetical protein
MQAQSVQGCWARCRAHLMLRLLAHTFEMLSERSDIINCNQLMATGSSYLVIISSAEDLRPTAVLLACANAPPVTGLLYNWHVEWSSGVVDLYFQRGDDRLLP